MIALQSCPVCGSSHIAQYQAGIGTEPYVIHEIIPGVKVNAAVVSRYWVCRHCQLIFQNPRLTDAELDKYYSRGYYRRTLGATSEEMDVTELTQAKSLAEILKQHIGEVTTHLDVGCGRGYLLEAVGAGVKVAVEPDINYTKVKGVKVYPKLDRVPPKAFDLVTAIQVLEHVSSPLDYLKSMAKFVGKNGYLVIEVPTWKSPGGPFRLAHLYHLEPGVLKIMCTQAGLSVVHTEFTPHLLLICRLAKPGAINL